MKALARHLGPFVLATIAVLHCAGHAAAQASGGVPARDRSAPERYVGIQRAGMTSLAAFGAANVGLGVAGHLTTDGATQAFHQMNAMWGSVNLALGIIGVVSAYRQQPGSLTDAEAVDASRRARNVFLINGALDVLYIGAGTLSHVLGKRHGSDRATGYGSSVIAQGIALLVFDGVMAALHEKTLRRISPTLSLGPSEARLTLCISHG